MPGKTTRRRENLTAGLTSFVGRREELASLRDLLGLSRLVTLVGPAGVGKSRLAIEAARKCRRSFPDGAWFVALDSVSDLQLVGHAVASALDLTVPSTETPEAVLRDRLRARRALLIFDNCEHLLGPTGELIAELLRAAPEVQVLATSRLPMRIGGELAWPVPPLSLVGKRRTEAEAVELLANRAAAAVPGFRIEDDERAVAAAICVKLDGLPLAIELAATRLRVMSLPQLLLALDDRFAVLSVGPADAPERHRSLRAAVEWSYELCSADERELWISLSMLPGGFDLAAAAGMAGLDGEVEVIPAIEGLIDLSVLIGQHVDGAVRFRMLETIRELGRERADALGRREVLRERLCTHYLELAERAESEMAEAHQSTWLRRMRDERPNLWSALEIALEQPAESTIALRITAALWFLWVSGATGEGRYWLDRALGHGGASSIARARALWTAGYVSLTAGDLARAKDHFGAAVDLGEEIGEEALVAQAEQLLGVANMFLDDLDAAVALLERSVERTGADLAPHPSTAIALGQLGVALTLRGDVVRGGELAERCAELLGDDGNDLWSRSWSRWLLAVASWFGAEPPAARPAAEAALRLKLELRDQVGVAACLELIAWIAKVEGQNELPVLLVGAADRIWRSSGGNRLFGFEALLRKAAAYDREGRETLGPARHAKLLEAGAALSDEEAARLALGTSSDPTDELQAAELTPREVEVARLVAAGMSNRQIAARLVIANRTVESHVEHIRTKLGFNSRTQVAAWVAAGGVPG